MDKLTAIKIKYDDGTYSDEIPVSVLSENVEWDSTHTLVDVLGSIDVDVTGTIQDQISQLFNKKVDATQLNNYVASQLSIDATNWLNNNVDPVGSAVIVDSSLTISGAAADAKKTGDEISDLKSALTQITENSNAIVNYKIAHSNADKGVSVSVNGSAVKIQGTSSDIDLWWITEAMPLSAGTYTVATNDLDLSTINTTLQILKTDSSGTKVSGIASVSNKMVTFTLTETTYVRLRLYLASGKTFNSNVIVTMVTGPTAVVYSANDVIAKNDITKIRDYFYQSNIAVVTAEWLSAQGYADVMDLPLNKGYAINSSSGLTGLPVTAPATLFVFSPQSKTDITYATYLLIYRDKSYFALRYTSDTSLAWQDITNVADLPSFDLSSTKKIVLIGDSITQGVGSSDYSATGDTIYSDGTNTYKRNVGVKAWGAQFVVLMTNKYGCTCDNNGLPGFDINELYGVIDDICPSSAGYNYAVVMCGTNSRGKSYRRCKQEYTWLLTAIKNKGVTPFVFSTIDNNGASNVTTNPEMMQQCLKGVCDTLGVPFFDMTSEFTGYISKAGLEYSEVFADTLHPNDKGYAIIYGIIREKLGV